MTSFTFGYRFDMRASIPPQILNLRVRESTGDFERISIEQALFIALLLEQRSRDYSFEFRSRSDWEWMLQYMKMSRASFDRMIRELVAKGIVEKRHESTKNSVLALTGRFVKEYLEEAR